MKEILSKLKENIEIGENLIQFRIDDEFYELDKNKNGDWIIFTLLGSDLNLNTKKLKNLDRAEVEKILKDKYSKIQIY